MIASRPAIDTSNYFTTDPQADAHSLSDTALGLTGSEILKIASEISWDGRGWT